MLKQPCMCLINDIYKNYLLNKESFYYIGSLIVFQRHDGILEVIDGQQRLTVLSILVRLLRIVDNVHIYYDSRPEVEAFFKELYSTDDKAFNKKEFSSSESVPYLIEAVNNILNSQLFNGGVLRDLLEDADFISYVKKNVFIVRVEVPEDTDVASYFEIMNNRGEQLKKHEILKSLMMGKINNPEESSVFAYIWDSCSQMDSHIESLISAEYRKRFFIEYGRYNELLVDGNLDSKFSSIKIKKGKFSSEKGYSLKNILSEKKRKKIEIAWKDQNNSQSKNEEDNDEELSLYKSIIDFSNFLMHLFKLKYAHQPDEVSLDESLLIETYKKLAKHINPMDFIKDLLFFRICFDRFVVKSEYDERKEDNYVWSLKKPYIYKTSKTSSLKYRNTFSDQYEKKIIKALSMLQVTFRTQKYKNWLQELLVFFRDKKDILNISSDGIADDFISCIHKIINDYFKNNYSSLPPEDYLSWDYAEKGTATPHFLFNFLDYLIWLDGNNTLTQYEIKDFDFRYYSSVEHHFPQNDKEQLSRVSVDNFGNLCLVSRRDNSRLSDRLPKQKASRAEGKNLGPKRQIMYKITNERDWSEEQIIDNLKLSLSLFRRAEEILKIQKSI